MAKNKYYAVRNGRSKGIYYTWSECQEQTDGYSGSDYKGFSTLEEAEAYLYAGTSDNYEETTAAIDEKPATDEIDETYHIQAYVDGSYNQDLGKYAFGCVILTPNGDVIRESGSNDDPESVLLRNIAGEMLGAMYAVKWAIKNGYQSIDLFYDYEGIEKWATHQWRAKNKLTAQYADFMSRSASQVLIKYRKVVAHTGVRYNEEADFLAKKALTQERGIPRVKRGAFWYTVEGISREDLETVIKLVVEELGTDKASYTVRDNNNGCIFSIAYKSKEKEQVAVSYFNRSGKTVVQGKIGNAFSTITTYITELVDFDDIPTIFNSTYHLDVNRDNVISQFQSLLPNSYDKLPPKLAKSLHQAVYNLNLSGDMFDATFLAQPVIRAIDGHLKNVILINIPGATSEDIRMNGYHYFEKIGEERYTLDAAYIPVGMSDGLKRYIGNCYSFFHRNRNVLSHWDDPTTTIDTTKLLDVHSAHDLITRTLALIDKYYEIV